MYKIVAMDLDGTLFNQYQKISVKNLEALEALKRRHTYLVIASGRTHGDISHLVEQLGLSEYDRAFIVSYNGVVAAKTNPYQVIYRKMIHGFDVRSIARLVEPMGLKMHVFCDKKVYLSEDTEYTIDSDSELMLHASRVKMTEYDGPEDVYKVLLLDDGEKLDDFQKTIPPEFLDRYTIFKSASHLLEFVHKLGSKGDALSYIANSLGIDRGDVMAFGDEENDISMLKFAGMGIAMDNAKSKVKKSASVITLSNKLDGVAEAINKYILLGEEQNHDI